MKRLNVIRLDILGKISCLRLVDGGKFFRLGLTRPLSRVKVERGARGASVSIIKLTPRNWRNESSVEDEPEVAKPGMVVNNLVATLNLNKPLVALLTVLLIRRCRQSAFTIEEKLSSMRIMSETSCATSVPAIPIEKPISAALSAGASLVLSPVTAILLSNSFRR